MNILKNNKGFIDWGFPEIITCALLTTWLLILIAIITPSENNKKEDSQKDQVTQEMVNKTTDNEIEIPEEYFSFELNEFLLKYPQYLVIINDNIIYKRLSEEELAVLPYPDQNPVQISLDSDRDPTEAEYTATINETNKIFMIGSSEIYVKFQNEPRSIIFYAPEVKKEVADPLPPENKQEQISEDPPQDQPQDPPQKKEKTIIDLLKKY